MRSRHGFRRICKPIPLELPILTWWLQNISQSGKDACKKTWDVPGSTSPSNLQDILGVRWQQHQLQFLVVETAPKTNISDIWCKWPHYFANFKSSFARLFTKIALLRASPVSDWMLQDFFDDFVFFEFIFERVPKSLQKMGSKLTNCSSIRFFFCFFWVGNGIWSKIFKPCPLSSCLITKGDATAQGSEFPLGRWSTVWCPEKKTWPRNWRHDMLHLGGCQDPVNSGQISKTFTISTVKQYFRQGIFCTSWSNLHQVYFKKTHIDKDWSCMTCIHQTLVKHHPF